MTRTRIHDLPMSLDGLATGEGQALDAPFGHAGIDDAFAQQHEPGIGAEIMARASSTPGPAGRRRPDGVVGPEALEADAFALGA
ncbi:hypothetical protein [Geodermatophilus siccatus]|nr:hypothetical protein [Geodermatophilus siccatus]